VPALGYKVTYLALNRHLLPLLGQVQSLLISQESIYRSIFATAGLKI
jgi:hypothetical protein